MTITDKRNAYHVLKIDKNTATKDIRKAFTAWKKARKGKSVKKGAGTDNKRKRSEERSDNDRADKKRDDKEHSEERSASDDDSDDTETEQSYEILSNEEKRAKYDETLKMNKKQILEKIHKHCYNTDKDAASITGKAFNKLNVEQLRRIYIVYDVPQSHKILHEIPEDAPDKPKGFCLEENTLIYMWKAHQKKNHMGQSTPWANPTTRAPFSKELGREIAERKDIRNVELLTAIDTNNMKRIEYLLKHGVSPNFTVDTISKTPLLNHAIKESKPIQVIDALLKAGATPNYSDVNGMSSFLCTRNYKGTEEDKNKLLELLKTHGADANAQLRAAILANNIDGINDLIFIFGADIRHRHEGHDVLSLAAFATQHGPALLRTLLDLGASTSNTYNVQNKIHTILTVIFKFQKPGYLHLAETLIERDPQLILKHGSAGPPITIAITSKNNVMFDWCIDHGANINIIDDSHRTVLIHAIQYGTEHMVDVLLAKGQEVNAMDVGRDTALHFAILTKNIDIVRKLLGAGADINIQNSKGNTPMHYTFAYHQYEITKLLAQRGANLVLRNNNRQYAIQLCMKDERIELFKFLVEEYRKQVQPADYDIKILFDACRSKCSQAILTLLQAGFDPTIRDNATAESTLTYAIHAGHGRDVLDALIKHGADINWLYHDQRDLLMCAVLDDNIDAIQFLLQRGASVHHRDVDGVTSLHLACSIGHEDTVFMLLQAHSDPNAKSNTNSTPLMYAAEVLHDNVISMLLHAGADPNIKDNSHHTAIYYTLKNNVEEQQIEFQKKCIRVLLESGATMTPVVRERVMGLGIDVPPQQHAGKSQKTKKIPKPIAAKVKTK